MLGLLRGVVRGGVAWLVGWLLTLGASVAGLHAAGGGFTGAATAYLRTHALPPTLGPGLVVVIVALAVGGVRAGRSTRSGATGRLKAVVQSVRGTELNRARSAAVAGAFLAVGYAIVGVAVGLWLGTQAGPTLVGGLVYGLVVGMPVAVGAALY